MSSIRFLYIAALATTAVAKAISATGPSVSTIFGIINGGHCERDVQAVFYKGIPYAEPPVNELRFAAPQAYSSRYSQGVLNATTAASSCIQFGRMFAETGATSEDCLFLDIWTPYPTTETSKLPVKVWIYGGYEYDGGISDPLYDGCNAAAAGAIVVSINYRLGPLGFLALEDAGIGGNQGIQDILMGLQWIQDHIARFGGDPTKVALFGQSAGAINTYVISTLPRAPQLINSAIMESGGGRDVASYKTMQTLGSSYSKTLNCSIADDSCLRNKSVPELITAWTDLPLLQEGVGSDGVMSIVSPHTYSFVPYLDGEVIPFPTSEVGTQVPAIFGYNTNDGALFVFAAYEADPTKFRDEDDAYTAFLRKNFGSAASLVRERYDLSQFSNSKQPLFAAMTAVITDASYKCPAYRGLQSALKNKVPVWAYEFSHVPHCSWSLSLPQSAITLLGPTHTAEIPFVFGNLDYDQSPNGTCNGTAAEYVLSDSMMQAWSEMAVNGRPFARSAPWPRYNPEKGYGWSIARSIETRKIDYGNCDFWERVYDLLS